MPYAWTNGFRTYYEDEGEGFPVVFIHGHTFDHTMWEPQVDALVDTYRTVILDLRGHGLSEVPTSGYWPASYMQDVRVLVDYLGIQRCALVGNSVGGSVVAHFALEYPARTAALVLAGAGGGGPPRDPERIVMHKGMREVTAARGYLPAIEEFWMPGPLFRGARKRPEIFDRVQAMCRGYSGQGFRDPDRAQTEVPLQQERYAEIQAPTLVIHGDLDTADVRNGADFCEKIMPNVQHVVIPDTGHTAMLEEPEVFNQHLQAFLQKALSADRQPPRRR